MVRRFISVLRPLLFFSAACMILYAGEMLPPVSGSDNNSKIIVGMNRDYPPHEFLENGKPQGFNVDVVEWCARNIGMAVEWRPMAAREIYAALERGDIDAACMSISHARQQLFKFTHEPIFEPAIGVFIRKGTTGINSIEDLNWRTVAAEENHTSYEELKEYHHEVILIAAASQDDALRMVENGDVLAAYVEYHTGEYLIGKYGWTNLTMAKEITQVAPRGIAFAKGRDELRDRFEKALLELKKSGEYDDLLKKWFKSPGISPHFWKRVLAITGVGFGVLIGMLLLSLIWNRALRIRIREQTKELVENERFLHGVFEGIQDGLSVLDKDLNIIRVNDAMRKWYSFREPLEGKKCYEAYLGRDEACTWCPSVRTLNTGQPDYEMAPYIDAEGRKGFMDVFTSPFREKDGRVVGIIEYVRDATERENSRLKMEQAKRDWENIFESISDSILIMDLNHVIIDANRATLKALGGISKEEVIGKYCYSIFHKSDEPTHGCPLEVLKNSQNPETVEMEMEALDGWYLVTAAPVLDEEGRFTKIIHIARNITERKKSETAMRESEARFHGIVDNARFGVVMHRDGEVIFANKMAYQILGYGYGEKLLKPMEDHIIPGDRRQILDTRKRRKVNEPVAERHQITVIRKDGKKVHMDMGVSVIPYKGEMVDIVSFMDMTEQRQLEEQLLQAQKMEAVGRMAGGIAHDFNNILTAITGYTDLLTMQLEKGEPFSTWISEIHRAADRAATLTSQLLTFSRRQIIRSVLLDINEVVIGAEKLLKRVLGEDIELDVHIAPTLRLVRADRTQIEQVIMNLAINARDAMIKGGKLSIETANVTLDEEYCKSHLEMKPGPFVMLAVTDNGTGMDEETKRQVFDPFFTTKEPGKGTGLGLSTVYGIIKQSGGHIWLYSELGQGTTFKVYLPAATGKLDEIEEKEHKPLVSGGSETIMLVEDDEQVCDLTKRILENFGYNVISASQGEKALKMGAEYPGSIDLLITDLVMPKMGGVELAGKFTELRPDIKLLYITGYAEKSLVNNGFLNSDASVLQKPFAASVLAAKVREVLDKEIKKDN